MRNYQPVNSIVGREVYNFRLGLMGLVVKEDGSNIVVEYKHKGNTTVATTSSHLFNRNFIFVDEEGKEKPKTKILDNDVKERVFKTTKLPYPKGEPGCGEKMYLKLKYYIQSLANQDIKFVNDSKQRKQKEHYFIKYNGYNILEVSVFSTCMVVKAHPKALSTEVRKNCHKEYEKSTNWVLRSEFVFYDELQSALLKSLVSDSLYYRQVIEVLEREEQEDGENDV